MARTREWKLILNESRPPELYRMAGGWIERENVAEDPSYRDVLEALQAQIESVWNWEAGHQ